MGSQLPNDRNGSTTAHSVSCKGIGESKVGCERECSDYPNMAHSVGNLYVVLYQRTGEERRRVKRDSDTKVRGQVIGTS